MPSNTLADIRQIIDEIDTQIHDLVMQRGDVLEDIIALKKQEAIQNNQKTVIYHPAREAVLLKKILQRHQGLLPFSVIIELWRAMLSAFCGMQCEFTIAFYDPAQNDALRDLIRYYFGSLSKLKKYASETSVLHSVNGEQSMIGILPITNGEIINEWWLNLPQGLYVSGILPFVKNDPVVMTHYDHMIVSQTQPIETGEDKSLFKVTGNPDVGRVSIIGCFTDLDYQAFSINIHDAGDLSQRFHLIEVTGFFSSDQVNAFSTSLKKTSDGKILDVDYLGSYPAPVDLQEFV